MIESVIDAWQQFFHTPAPVASLAMFRPVLGGLIMVNAVVALMDARLFLSSSGLWFSANSRRKRLMLGFSLLEFLPDRPWAAQSVCVLMFLAGGAVVAGAGTTLALVVAWMTLVTYGHRGHLTMYSGDTLLRLMVVILIFSPCGRALSVDWWLTGSHGELWGLTQLIDPWTQRLIQVQISILYLITMSWKLRGSLWRRGTAVWYPINTREYGRFRVPMFPGIPILVRVFTWGTLATQFSMGVLVWIPVLHYWVMAAGLLMHAGMMVFLRLFLFMPIIMSTYLLFVSGADMVRVVRWLTG